ncbi:uncharacterized protein LOC132914129 [Bombus pascuorum]|uniref:uncharacterized protein LOC132914129 n=1 Tax=Bombus pascuorum TaxID=65598 RepID=UPI00298DD839|nr:uncharacterized protein LOC132914129 [Bombus pascuorum]
MAAYDFKKKEEVEEYLKNLYIEYQFGCLSEKKPEVCHLLGDYYESIKQNPKEALNLYKKNCDERGYGRSCTKYGDYRIMGTECEKDPKEAFKYMQKGCDKDDARGCLHAGALAISQEKLEPVRGSQILLGMKLLKKACDLNQEKACFFLSGIYLSGIEGYVEKNLKEAYQLSLKCCEFNNPYACANLSIMHKKGDGVQKNAELAETFRTRANEIFKDLKENKKPLKFHQGIDPLVPVCRCTRNTMRCYLFTASSSITAILAVAFLGHSAVVAGGESNAVINVGVYYESLCPDSMRWIKQQLLPQYDVLKDYIRVTFVPYGKASHWKDPNTQEWRFMCQHGESECNGNKAQACGIHAIQNGEAADKVQQLTVALVGCAMTSRFPPSSLSQCSKKVGLSEQTQAKMDECVKSSLSDDLLVAYGEKTKELATRLSFVPTITINGDYSREIQSKALNNFFKLICDTLTEGAKPSECSTA